MAAEGSVMVNKPSLSFKSNTLTPDVSLETVISSTDIFVAIDNNTLYGSKYTFLFYDKNH